MTFFNNPAFAQAASNLASAFAPPSGAEASGWAVAKAKQAEAARLEWLFQNNADPSASRRSALTGVQTYGNTPEGFRYNVDTQDATQRYGLDTQAATGRYGHDRTLDASRANNADDNARALTERDLMEATSVGNNVRDNQARVIGTPFGAIPQGSVRPAIPDEFMSALGFPGVGEVRGSPKPLSETEWQAGQNQRLLDQGTMVDDDLMERITGERTPVRAIGPDGRPMFMSPGAAVRQGAEPAPTSPTTVVNTGDTGDGNQRKKLDEAEGTRWSGLQAAATTASGLQQDLAVLSELITQAPQGPIVGRLAEYFPEATTAGAAFTSIISRAAPGLRVEGSGATSDIEYNGMVRSLPRLRNNPEGNRLIVAAMQAKGEINIQRGEVVTAYQNGDIDAAEARQRLSRLNSQSILTPELKAMIGGESDSPDAGASATAAPASPVRVSSPEEARQLPSGTAIMLPDGSTGRVP